MKTKASELAEVKEALSLFLNPIVSIVVRRYNGEIVQILDHFPNDKVRIEELS